jgi:hypothetical protein
LVGLTVALATGCSAFAETLTVDGWSLSSEIEGGNAASIRRFAEDHVAIAPREDALPVDVQVTGPISSLVMACMLANERAVRV